MTDTKDPYAGTVALVSGGGTGIGRATALLLAERGANVLIAGRRQGPLDETAELLLATTVLPLAADVRDPSAVHQLVRAAIDRWGRLDTSSTTPAPSPPPPWRR